jgi:hypothetical protein
MSGYFFFLRDLFHAEKNLLASALVIGSVKLMLFSLTL